MNFEHQLALIHDAAVQETSTMVHVCFQVHQLQCKEGLIFVMLQGLFIS